MAEHAHRIRALEAQIARHESEVQRLRAELQSARLAAAIAEPADRLESLPSEATSSRLGQSTSNPSDLFLARALDGGLPNPYHNEIMAALGHAAAEPPSQWPLSLEEYRRYGRQLIMPEVGMRGQLRLKRAKVLVVGCGGLGCPAALYLAGAGVGTIGLVDGDEVEESNLHRQVLHRLGAVGKSKVDSAVEGLQALNPLVRYQSYPAHLTPETAVDVVAGYDVVLDCTDNPASRYLISDTCVLLGKPLVSASALKTEGQLMVLNNPPKPAGDVDGGPCYRCVFPKPPPPESVVTCGEGGILGPVVGVMGILQALEALKVIIAEDKSPVQSASPTTFQPSFGSQALPSAPPSLLIFSAYSSMQFRTIKLRSRSPRCAACSTQTTITLETLQSGSLDYIQFCGVASPVDMLGPTERASAQDYAEVRKKTSLLGQQHRLIDVREKVQFDLCHLYGSVNIPFSRLQSIRTDSADFDTLDLIDEIKGHLGPSVSTDPLFVVCRLGNDSQIAVRKLKELGLDEAGTVWVGDIRGGLRSWRQEVDPTFPDY